MYFLHSDFSKPLHINNLELLPPLTVYRFNRQPTAVPPTRVAELLPIFNLLPEPTDYRTGLPLGWDVYFMKIGLLLQLPVGNRPDGWLVRSTKVGRELWSHTFSILGKLENLIYFSFLLCSNLFIVPSFIFRCLKI